MTSSKAAGRRQEGRIRRIRSSASAPSEPRPVPGWGRSAAVGTALAALALSALVPPPALAGDVAVGDIVVHQPWARATPGGAQVGGGYLTVENRGSAADRLMGGSFAASSGFELHSMTMDGGVMRMRPAGPLEIPAGKSVTLDPSGLHIMFTGLKRGLKKGETVPGTLVFEHAGTAKVDFAVGGIADRGPGGGAGAARDGRSMPGMDMD